MQQKKGSPINKLYNFFWIHMEFLEFKIGLRIVWHWVTLQMFIISYEIICLLKSFCFDGLMIIWKTPVYDI